MNDELAYLSIRQLGERIRRRQISCEDVVRQTIERTNILEKSLNSYITFAPEAAIDQARKLDKELAQGKHRGFLHGIPVSLKDNFDVLGMPTTAGCRLFHDNIPSTDSAVARRFKNAGAIIMGKANMNKFAAGGFHSEYGDPKNPWNPVLDVGPSSSGPAVQVSAGLVWASVGTDNGGSIRFPAATCGILGLKPTYSLVSMDGCFPRVYSFDHAGPLARTAEDCAEVMQILAGHEAGDATTAKRRVPDYRLSLTHSIKGIRVGVVRNFDSGDGDVEKNAFAMVAEHFASLGAVIVEFDLPVLDELQELFSVIGDAELAAAHQIWITQHPEVYSRSLTKGAEAGGFGISSYKSGFLVSAARYIQAQQRRLLLQREYARATSVAQIVLMAEAVGAMDMLGVPALSICCGYNTEDKSPLAFQISGRAFDEATVLRAAFAYEQTTEHHRKHPEMSIA